MTKWTRTIRGVPEILDQFDNDVSVIPKITEDMIELLKNDGAYPNDRELFGIVEEFEIYQGEEDMPYFDLIMNSLYDWADRQCIWIEPLPARA